MAGKDLSLGITLLANERICSVRWPGGWVRIVDDSAARILRVIRVELRETYLAEQQGTQKRVRHSEKDGGSN